MDVHCSSNVAYALQKIYSPSKNDGDAHSLPAGRFSHRGVETWNLETTLISEFIVQRRNAMYKKHIVAGMAILSIGAVLVGGCKKETQQKAEAPQTSPAPAATPVPMIPSKTGETLFKQHCAVCHPDGGNIVSPQKTLHRKNLAAHKINKPEDIVKIMRNPGQGMNRFDEATIPDKDAMSIAEFVLNTYK